MEITGRITANAVVHKVGNDKQVVNFSIAINDNYKPKGSTEVKEVATYINCSYWLNPKIAEWWLLLNHPTRRKRKHNRSIHTHTHRM
jgi:single-strand DNA-binding protein